MLARIWDIRIHNCNLAQIPSILCVNGANSVMAMTVASKGKEISQHENNRSHFVGQTKLPIQIVGGEELQKASISSERKTKSRPPSLINALVMVIMKHSAFDLRPSIDQRGTSGSGSG